jgi:hypothetical protein
MTIQDEIDNRSAPRCNDRHSINLVLFQDFPTKQVTNVVALLGSVDVKSSSLGVSFVQPLSFPLRLLPLCDGGSFNETLSSPFPRQSVNVCLSQRFRSVLQSVLKFFQALINGFVGKAIWELKKEVIGSCSI